MIRAAPGLALAGVGVAVSLGAHRTLPDLPPLVLCVALGVALANLAWVPDGAAPGLRVAAGPVLKLGVVLLNVTRLRQIGARPLALGLISWSLIAVVAYAGVRLAWA